MSVLPSVKENWIPSKEFITAVCECYHSNQTIDLTKFSAEDWTQAVAFSDFAEDLLWRQPTKEQVDDFIYDMMNLDREFDLESLCSFGNISFVIGFNLHDFEKLTKSLRYVIDNKIPMNKSNIVFQSICENISHRWFENWKKEQSVIVGATLVDLCDYLKINIEPIDESIADWNIEESEVECIARTNKEELKKFARLFRKPINKWYGDKWFDI